MPTPAVPDKSGSRSQTGEPEPDEIGPDTGVNAPVPAKLDRRAWWSAARATALASFDLDTSLRCAGVAFFGFLSIFPAMSAAVALFGLIADPLTIARSDAAIAAILPLEVTEVIAEQLMAFAARETKLGIGLAISLLVALWTGSRGMNALVYAMSKAHKEQEDRHFVRSVLMSLAATLGAFLTLGVIITAVTIVPAVALIWPFPESRETAVLWLRWPVVVVVLMTAVLLLFRYAPNRRSPQAYWVLPGAILATLLWLLGSVALSFFVENFGSYDATFGSIAAAAVFMLWLYFSALVLVAGATLNAELEWRTRRDTTIGPDRPMGSREAYVADTLADDAKAKLDRAV